MLENVRIHSVIHEEKKFDQNIIKFSFFVLTALCVLGKKLIYIDNTALNILLMKFNQIYQQIIIILPSTLLTISLTR